MSANADIGLSRKQRVFAKAESAVGTMVFPSGTLDFILPAGNAEISQTPAFADSEELANTLDVLDQFQNATPAGKWKLAMYLRPTGTVGVAQYPQGKVLLVTLQGIENAATTSALVGSATAVDTSIPINTIAGGVLPVNGVVNIAEAGSGGKTEMVHYTGITRTSRTATTATLTGCTRGYASTTAATHTAGNVTTLVSSFYRQSVNSPTFSLWIETDHLVQGLSGCSIESATFDVSNEGAVKLSLEGQGMQMVYAGTSKMTGTSTATATHIHVTDASLFSAGAVIYDTTFTTKATISTVDIAGNILNLVSATGAAWATPDVIRGYLPTGTEIGDPIEAKDTVVKLNGVAASIKKGALTVKTPKKYLDDEVGIDYPEDFLEDKRDITSTLGLYFRKADAKYFTDGMQGDEAEVLFAFGDTAGSIVEVYLKRCQLTVPAVNFASPAVELNIPIKALGTVGEDSVEITVR